MKKNGFTLIEMLVAVMILTLAVTALLSVSAGTATSVRYAKDKIVATWLAQQSLDYVRNSRDSAMIANTDPTNLTWWATWVSGTLGNPGGSVLQNRHIVNIAGTGCFASTGCYVSIPPISQLILTPFAPAVACATTCPTIAYNQQDGQYEYPQNTTVAVPGGFVVRLQSTAATPDNIDITATVTWLDGTLSHSLSQSILLANWQLQ